MLSPSFVRVLAAGRSRYNQRAADIGRRYPAFDYAAFAEFLHGAVDPLVAAVERSAPERLQAVADAAYDIGLELTARLLVGPAAASAHVDLAWRRLAPPLAALIAQHPRETLGLFSNAVIHLQAIDGSRPAQWIAEMAALAGRTWTLAPTLAQLQVLGQVLAWRAGASHFRQGAIAAADSLPPALAVAAFGGDAAADAESSWPAMRAALIADPWWRARGEGDGHGNGDGNGAAWREVGAFAGLGGQFAVPPQVRPCAQGFMVKSGERCFLLVADAWGAVLHAATAPEFDAARAVTAAGEGAAVISRGRRIALDLPEHGLAVCRNDSSIAVSSPYTHAIRLLPL